MRQRLDILMLESHAHAGDDVTVALEAAGHRVVGCYDDPEVPFPCRGLIEPDGCPLDGHIDVAVLAQRGRDPWPTALESGVRCAIRAGLPVVESGTGAFDPYHHWVSARVPINGEIATACTDAVDRRFDLLREMIGVRIEKLLDAQEVDASSVISWFDEADAGLDVHLELPTTVSRGMEEAFAVRVLDAIHASGRTYARLDVHIHTPASPSATPHGENCVR
jgi:hypothetical protein